MIAGLGGLEPGYVLIASSSHQRSLRAAARVQGLDFVRFIGKALAYLEHRLGPLTFWEHGAPHDQLRRSSACIEHAHLHAVPGSLALPEPMECSSFSNVEAALKADRPDVDGYLLLGWSARHVLVGADPRVSQYYRREWARLVGRDDEWDYLVAENPRITATTMRLLAPGNDGL
jgi:hypothetical protein